MKVRRKSLWRSKNVRKFANIDFNAKGRQWALYALTEGDSRVRYLGITSRPLEVRLKDHLRECRDGKSRKNNWIRFCRTNNKPITIHLILGGLSFERALKLEGWIIKLLAHPFDLVNAAQTTCDKHWKGIPRTKRTHAGPSPLFVVTVMSGRKRLLRLELFDTPKGLFPSVTRAVEKVRCVLSNYRPISQP